MNKDEKKMLTGAIKDLENTIESWQKVINSAEEAKYKAIEDLKEVTRLIKKVK